jgi:hypothetical protein
MNRELALANLRAILAEQPPTRVYDEHALRAFGIARDDADAFRELARWLAEFGYAHPAQRFASRLLSLRPKDSEGLRIQARADSLLAELRKSPRGF